ncbi:AraC family transcriptional regulator [Pseudomonadales bacterium]|jgi:AraC-like DNA-binding protein|nr:AraC family transcriptional regulator [Pseudomonadales bacterium]|tara:strand:+ start:2074 stop:3072 length:999 start_codon:yes stop_codon:yes gene_type:complete
MATIFSERLFSRFEREMGPSVDELEIPRAIFHRPDIEYSLESYFRLLDRTARSGYPDIGFRVGSSMDLADIGALGHAVKAAPTVGQGLALWSRYLFVMAHGNVIRIDVGQDIAVVSWAYTELYPGLHEQDTEIAISCIARTIAQLSGRTINPSQVEFQHTRPNHGAQMDAFFSCPVLFGRRGNRLLYPKSCLDLANPNSDPSLLKALDFYLAERIKVREDEGDNLLNKVRHFIANSLGEGTPEIVAIASILGMSARTLQRRLAVFNIVFSDLVDAARHEIAVEYVRHSEYSLTEIALMLGYSEHSAFSRAFRRWAGCSPQQARDEQRETPSA